MIHPPEPTEPPDAFAELALGESTTCVRRVDGRVTCRGALSLPPTLLNGALVVSDQEVCARAEGQVVCVRDGVTRQEATAFVEVTVGAGSTVARDQDGGVWTFRGEQESGVTLHPVDLGGAASRVAADGTRACALVTDGTLYCWDPYMAMTRSPLVQVLSKDVRDIRGSWLMTCYNTDKIVKCWRGRTSRVVPGMAGVDRLAVGGTVACVLQGDRQVSCWTATGPPGPVNLDDRLVADLAVGTRHACVLFEDRSLHCWGDDSHGQVTGAFP